MQYKLERGAHSVYTLQYHLVQVVKYRKKVFDNEKIIKLLKEKIFHMIFKSKPTLEIPKYLNAIKTITSREIRRTYPELKEKLWGDAFWSPSYFLATTGQVTLEQLKKYVGNQGQREIVCN
ncbi:hypothetical protein METP2_00115 [Methanosarcinales archaeon]|nr:IS200/IS605 family transposase [Candidatus Methanoperedens sp.]CAG0949483.1 hypothetical protein METP2_00115 [Methanosarcinales archaeon]